MSGRRVVCLGEALIDLVAWENGRGLGTVRGFTRAVGGAPANVAVGIARLGGTSAFVGRVGDDPFGHAIADELAAEGVDLSYLRFDSAARTSLAFVGLGPDGERDFLFYPEHSSHVLLGPVEVDPAFIRSASALHVGTVSLSVPSSAATTRDAIAVAVAAHVPVTCDVNLRPQLWDDPAEMLDAAHALFSSCTIVKVSEEEARVLTQAASALVAARTLCAMGPRLAVVTLGHEGAAFALDGDAARVPGFTMRAIDTTGAGDAFIAALLVELERSGLIDDPGRGIADVREAIVFANAAGALATRRRGVIPALPRRAEVKALISEAAVQMGR